MRNSKVEIKKKQSLKANSGIIKLSKDHRWYYKHGMMHVIDSKYRKALLFMRRAHEMNPGNVEYAFNMAGILAVLKDYKNSNKYLIDLMNNKRKGFTDCYFGLGCNYLDMGKYTVAVKYFEKYLRINSKGPFTLEACKALFYLRTEGIVPLRKQWEAVIDMAVNKRELVYGNDYPEDIEWMWLHFIYIILEGKNPVIRNVNAWAAFIEYLYCSINGCTISQNHLASKYGLTENILNRKVTEVLKKITY